MMLRWKYIALLTLSLHLSYIHAEEDPDFAPHHSDSLLHHLSFAAPFAEHDAKGARVLPWWNRAGEALLKQSFLRLTPDTKLTQGSAWSQNMIGHKQFSLEWKFRISGLDEKDGGESMGLFITDKTAVQSGGVFGFADKFVGIGVVIDTNRAPGSGRHRDVSVVYNNGKKDATTVLNEMTGCNANLRYWEGRDDFNVLKASRIRIKWSGNSLVVEIDSRNTGRWRRCATLVDPDLPADWTVKATVGLLAVNGAQSNNNDVLSIKTFNDPDAAWQMEHYEGEDDADSEWSLLVHHIEHEMFTVHNSLKSTINLLETAENEAEQRITTLEDRLNDGITKALEARMAALEAKVHKSVTNTVHTRIGAVERGMSDKLDSTMHETVKSASKAWKTPFYLLVGVVGAMSILSYFKYRELRKEHLL